MYNRIRRGNNKGMSKFDKNQKATITVAVITSFITTFTGSALNLSIPTLNSEFGVSAAAIGWIVTGYMLTVAVMTVPFGRIADITSRKKILETGIFTFMICAVFAVFSWKMWILLILRIMQGVGAAMIFSTNHAILISAFPGSERGRVLGYALASTYVGLAAGPVIGGIINHYLGWRFIFVFIAAVSFVAWISACKKLPAKETGKTAEGEAGSFDIWGNLLFVLMVFCFMFGLSTFATIKYMWIAVIAGIVTGVIFVIHESRHAEPVIKVSLFKNSIAYSLSNVATFLNYGATFAISYLLSIYLQTIMGYTSQIAGIILIIQPLIMAVLSPYMGRLSDRISPFKLATAGMGFCAAGLFMLIFIGSDTSIQYIAAVLVVTGLGFAVFSSPNTNAVMSLVEKEDYGVATSILATMRSMGHTTSMAIITLVVGMYMGSSSLADAEPEVLIKTVHVLFTVFTILCIVGVFFSIGRKSTDKESQ